MQLITVLYCAVAATVANLGLDEEPGPTRLRDLLALTTGATLASWLLVRTLRKRQPANSDLLGPFAICTLAAMALLPFVVEVYRELTTGNGRPLEVPSIAALRNLGIGLAAFSASVTAARLAVLVGLFLVVAGAPSLEGNGAGALLATYGLSGVAWLIRAYWERLPTPAQATRPRGRGALTTAAALGVIALATPLLLLGPGKAGAILAEFLPSSGGTGQSDPDARGGLGDGDDQVRGEQDPRSIGYTDSEIYLETDRPSLYDAFNDTYGEPIRPRRLDRMIAMDPQNMREQEKRPDELLKAGRSFSMSRRKPRQRPEARQGTNTDALLYLEGPTPAHLRLSAFDRFDGQAWQPEPRSRVRCPLETETGSSWIWLRGSYPVEGARPAYHRVKVARLESSSLPLPANVERFRVGSVDRADFFGWAQHGILRMEDRDVPPTTVIECVSHPFDPKVLALPPVREGVPFASPAHIGKLDAAATPAAVTDLAREWTRGVPRGWPQVEAIVGRLRSHCRHDPAVVVDDSTSGDPVSHFLSVSRRGADYQFATAAVLMLRSRGYPARVLSGFYAAPGKYDHRTRQTPIRSDDVHLWAEVLLPGPRWVEIEPTPGYEILRAAPAWWHPLATLARALASWAVAHAVALSAGLTLFCLTWRFPAGLLDRVATSL